jgi:hypothetical protein
MEAARKSGRVGEISRTLPHGTVMIWDVAKARSYPFYSAGHDVFLVREAVEFATDATDTYVVKVSRVGGSGSRKPKRVAAVDQNSVRARAV